MDIRNEVEKGNPERLKSIKLVPNSGAHLYFANDSEQYVGFRDRIQDNGANALLSKTICM